MRLYKAKLDMALSGRINRANFMGAVAHMVIDVYNSRLALLCWCKVAHCSEQHLHHTSVGRVSGPWLNSTLPVTMLAL